MKTINCGNPHVKNPIECCPLKPKNYYLRHPGQILQKLFYSIRSSIHFLVIELVFVSLFLLNEKKIDKTILL